MLLAWTAEPELDRWCKIPAGPSLCSQLLWAHKVPGCVTSDQPKTESLCSRSDKWGTSPLEMHLRCFCWEAELLRLQTYLLQCTTDSRSDIFKLRVMASSSERHLSFWTAENPPVIVSPRWTRHLLSTGVWPPRRRPTLTQHNSCSGCREQFLSDWVRVPLTFSHFTETVLKRPSQSPDFMAEPSQGPADLMDITRINQTFMPTLSSTAGDKAWLCWRMAWLGVKRRLSLCVSVYCSAASTAFFSHWCA